MNTTSTCSGCGLVLERNDGPVHAYVVTSPECWTLFTTSRGQPERMFTDAYMAQHPDGDDPRQLQSVASHLIALELVLAQNQPRSKTEAILVAAISVGREAGGFPALRRPEVWTWTIADVLAGRVDATSYANGVLSSWQETEPQRLGKWARETLERLYGS